MPAGRHVPLRSCVACGEKFPKRELVRIVRTSGGTVQVDPTGKAPGRGAYLCRKEECWERALRKSRLDYALRAPLGEQGREQLLGYYREQLYQTGVGELK